MYSVVDNYSDMGQIAQDYIFYTDHMERIKLDHVTQVIGYHPQYLEHFLRTQNFIMYGDGPLPYNYRHFLAIMAAARHRCTYLVELFEREFIDYGGDETWLQGLDHIPKKLLAICEINKILAHRPWLLTPEHISALAKGPRGFCWTMSEVVHAIVILSHIHSLSSFVFSCGLTQELENASPIIPPPVGTNQSSSGSNAGSSSPKISNVAVDLSTSPKTAAAQKKAVDVLMAKMLNLSQQSTECSEDELIDRFKSVEMQTAELSPTAGNSPSQLSLPINVLQYIDDPGFTYVDFARRGVTTDMPPTFRVQDYSWDDHGYSLVNRLYNDVGFLLDVKFRATYNLTYCTMAGRTNVDTSKFRRAIWNYIQCIYGIRHDDYDYGEVNQLLERPLKMFIKTACCFPERITKSDYDSILKELQHSEKVHVNLMILEARNQAELLYALRGIMRYMT